MILQKKVPRTVFQLTYLSISALASAACVHCHRRKVRCDARLVGLPCTNCRSSGKTDCRIHEKKKRLAARSILDPVPIRCRPPSMSEPESVAAKSLSPNSAGQQLTTLTTPVPEIPMHSIITMGLLRYLRVRRISSNRLRARRVIQMPIQTWSNGW